MEYCFSNSTNVQPSIVLSQSHIHPPSQPSPPSFSTSSQARRAASPIQSQMDTQIIDNDEALARKIEQDERQPITQGDEDSHKLAMLLTVADDDEDADDIADKFQSPRGRQHLFNGTAEEEIKEQPSNRNRRMRASKNELDDLIGSDEESRAIAESIRVNREETDGVTTRRGTVLGRKRKREEVQSVPISRKSHKVNFVDRNRYAAIDKAIHDSQSVEKSPPRRRSKRIVKQSDRDLPRKARRARETSAKSLRRSSRHRDQLRRNAPDSDDDEELVEEEVIDGDGESEDSDTSLRSSGSGGRDDEDPESEDNKSDYSLHFSQDEASDGSASEEEKEGEEGEDEEDEEDEEDDEQPEPGRKVVVRVKLGTRRSNLIRRKSHSVLNPQPMQSSKKKKGGKKTKKKKKRKMRRTNPNSVFYVEETRHYLSEHERKERLEALVKQSEDVAQKLNEAMAAEKQRNEEAAKERADAAVGEASPGRKLRKYEGDAVWPTAEGMEMQPHQVDGVRWMITLDSRGLNAILADEMGLGKTIQSIAFLATVCLGENRGPHLIIAPKNVVPHWAAEFENFYPGKFKVITHIGAGSERFDRLYENLRKNPDFDVLVTSYDLAQRDLLTKPKSENQTAWANRKIIREIQKLEFEYAVVDEAHRLKNAEAKFSVNLRKYTQAKRRLLLTGTPLSNSLQELWALMNVLNPRIFGNHAAFNEWFAAPFDTSREKLTVSEQSLIVSRLHTILRPFFRRRLRADVCPSYSSADEVIIRCPLSALQQAMIRHYLKSRKNKEVSANNTFMILRHIANHPFVHCGALFDIRELKIPKALVSVSGKFLFLYYALPKLITGGHRILIFSQFRKVLDFLEDLMELLGYRFARLDGETDNEDRNDTVSRFNAEGSPIPIFLLTTRAGGVGLNLQTADTVILFDSDWNPSMDAQAVSRIQRIGQKRTVHIMRLVSENSIDEAIVERGREKLRTEAVAVGAGNFNTNVDPTEKPEIRQKELEAILGKYENNALGSADFLNISEENTGNTLSSEAITKAKQIEWSAQLLRKDEKSLPENPEAREVIELNPSTVPEWLRPGKNMKSASLALKCTHKWQIPEALEKGEMHEKEKYGKLPAKRVRRQRFDFGSMTTDGGSDSEEYKTPDPDAIIESDSEDFMPEVDDNGKSLVVNVDALYKNSITVDTSPSEPSAVPISTKHNVAAPGNSVGNVTSTHTSLKSPNGAGHLNDNIMLKHRGPSSSGSTPRSSKLEVLAPDTEPTVKRTQYVPPPKKKPTEPAVKRTEYVAPPKKKVPSPKKKTHPVTEPVSDKSLSPQDGQQRRKSTATCERERTLEIAERGTFKYVQPKLTPSSAAGKKLNTMSSFKPTKSGGSSSIKGFGRLGGSSGGPSRNGSEHGSWMKKKLANGSETNSASSRKSTGSLARRNSLNGGGRTFSKGSGASKENKAAGLSRSRSNGTSSGNSLSNGRRNMNTAVKAKKGRDMEVIVIDD